MHRQQEWHQHLELFLLVLGERENYPKMHCPRVGGQPRCTATGRPQRVKEMEETGFSLTLSHRIFMRHSGLEETARCG